MASPEPTAPVLPGETLAGKYRVERILGRGGMGIVVAAKHLELDERVAIKFLLRDNPEAVERFLREARTAAKVKGEHVCRVFDVGRLETGEPYLVMEYLEGADLAERLAKDGPLPLQRVASWMIEACTALSEAHALGIVHRDLKPANVFLATRADGTRCVKLLDFGISKLLASDGMTSTTALMGSPAYMSPEQVVSARSVDHRADVWSLGAMLHELVTGAPPFMADSVIQLTVLIREGTPPAPSSLVSELPADFDLLVARCLAKDPADRYASMAEVARALAPFAEPAARHLVERVGIERAKADSDPALVATAHDADPAHRRVTPVSPSVTTGSVASPGVGQVTLEPITDGHTTSSSKNRRWLPVALLAAVGPLAFAGMRHWTPVSDAPDAMPVVASSPSSFALASASSIALPAPDAVAPVTIASEAPPAPKALPRPVASLAPRTVPLAATSSLPVSTDAPSATNVAPAASTTPAPEGSQRRKRTLDRSDPYAN